MLMSIPYVPPVLYKDEEEEFHCGQACLDSVRCQCSLCRSEKFFFFHNNVMCHRCCSKCMARCIGCPAATVMSADDVVAAVLGLTAGPNYKSELKQLNFNSHKCQLNCL